MPQCQFCGKNDMLPYKCSYCEKTFCGQHRLPENHECTAVGAGKKVVKKKNPEGEKKKSSTFTYNNEDDFID
nr:AN1-type zinc finger protein [Candidatus Sigynarchaeota archaeon]